jgi:tetratricopeptide (TPR) repeat protein
MKQTSMRGRSFFDHVKQALELCNDPAQLGERSPLATPYLLGSQLHGTTADAPGRGQALIAAIMQAAETLWGGPLPADSDALTTLALGETPPAGRYACLILELNYFKQRFRPAPRNQAAIYSDILHISRPTHDRHLRSAVEQLGTALLQHLRPAIHLEQPIPPSILIGREALCAQALAALRERRSLGINGPSGVGKSALGAAIRAQWANAPRFWYTFRPGLNDQLESLLFALGHFLHQHGASALWHQLIADRTRAMSGALALGLLLTDLAIFDPPPLLCFDELDTLHPPDQALPSANQQPLRELISGLSGHVALLLISQRPFLETAHAYELPALSAAELAELLTARAIAHTTADCEALHSYTEGNPRLVELCLALDLADDQDSLSDLLSQLPSAPTLLPIWLRVGQRLSADERDLLATLSVFRAPAPADVWLRSAQAATLNHLITQRLVQPDERGGVALLPALRTIIYQELSPEQRSELHQQAAQIRAERGEYTAAASHLCRAGLPETALELWYAQREQAINQGQAPVARSIFDALNPQELSAEHAKLLLLLRSELHELAGEPTHVATELHQSAWPVEHPATPEAMLRLGKAFEAQGQPQQALDTFQHGLAAVSSLLRQSAQLYVQRSLTNLRQRDMQQAWRDAHLARFHAETMVGIVHDQSGDYATATHHYEQALAIAATAEYPAGIAQTHHYLAMLLGRNQDLTAALPHFTEAIAFYERIGDQVNREIVRSNLASAYIHVRQFAAALAPAEHALRFFQAMGNSVRTAQNASNLAEAHAELGNLEQAEQYATLVLGLEEPQSHPYALYTLGSVQRTRRNWAQAERMYTQARLIAEANDDRYLLAFTWRALGDLFHDQGRLSEAATHYNQAIDGFTQLNLPAEVHATPQITPPPDA